MFHIALHFLVPAVIALLIYSKQMKKAFWVLILTMLVDLDHLLATPIYDPNRCSINFHPLHTYPMIGIYCVVFVSMLVLKWQLREKHKHKQKNYLVVEWLSLGLIIHMVLDWTDCYS